MNQPDKLRRAILLAGIAAMAAAVLVFVPPIRQDPAYHLFADAQTLWGVANWWNVVSNVPFLLAAVYGALRLRSAVFIERWERAAFYCVLTGTAAVAAGSSYYHLHPNDQRLFWDRLPMTVVFLSIVAATVGERVSMQAGRWLLAPLIVFGAGSVVYWRMSDDLRVYALVQFGSMLVLFAIFAMFPPRYSGSGWMWWMAILYVAAKVLEMFDRQIGSSVLATGGHPWKHLAAAGAVFVYIHWVGTRRPIVPVQDDRRSSLTAAEAPVAG